MNRIIRNVMVFHLVYSSVFMLLGYAGKLPCKDDPKYRCHPTKSNLFVRCTGGKLYQFFCPIELNFNTVTQTCDWPKKADCSWLVGNNAESNDTVTSKNSDAAGARKIDKGGAANGVDADGDDDDDDGDNGDRRNNYYYYYRHNKEERSKSTTKNWSTGTESKTTTKRPWWKPKQRPQATRFPPIPTNREKKIARSRPAYRNGPRERVKPIWKGSCESSDCYLPHCHCPSAKIPGGLSVQETPMMVMITFDDEISAAYYGYFQRLFRPGRYNPNGCPFRGAMYVSGEGTDYDLVYPLYAMGNEIACHTVSHRFPHTWWANASYEEYMSEIQGMKNNLIEKSGIPAEDIKGFRVPFLQLGGDNMYRAVYDADLVYDTSMFTGPVWEGSEDPIWPFTLDFVPDEKFCQHGPCPKRQYPGLWEIPVQRWYGVDGHSCAMPDGCTSTASTEEALQFLRKNFYSYYNSNRAPLGIFVHARWFHVEHHLEALDALIDELMQLDDVWIVTPSQVLEWMKKPTSIYEIQFFKPWSCEGAMKEASRRK